MDMRPDWKEPPTWRVGESVNEEIWEERVYDPVGLLLRRPLLVVRRTTDFTIAGSGTTTYVTFDTIDEDTDGMVLDSSSMDSFWVQRSGCYMIWASLCYYNYTGNTGNGENVTTRIVINGSVDNFTRESRCTGNEAGNDHWRALSTEITLDAGDLVQVEAQNRNTPTYKVVSQYNSPRLVILWLRP